MNDNVIINIDMDGVLAKWNAKASFEETFLNHYFLYRETEKVLFETVERMYILGWNVRVLSAVYTEGTAEKDKVQWLKNNGLSYVPYLFIPYGENKAKYIENDRPQVLLDDYTKNLKEWETFSSHNSGVKFLNGINGTHGTWTGLTCNGKMTSDQILSVIDAAGNLAANEGHFE